MGKSITCTFQVNVNVSNGLQYIYGAMSYKDVKGLILSENEYQKERGFHVVNAEIWPQTAKGNKAIKADYAVMDANTFEIEKYNISQPLW